MFTHIIFQYKVNVLSSNFASVAAGASLVSLKVHYQEAEVEPGAPELTSRVQPSQDAYFWMEVASKDQMSCQERSLLFSTRDEFASGRK